jgi:hypothetical protein
MPSRLHVCVCVCMAAGSLSSLRFLTSLELLSYEDVSDSELSILSGLPSLRHLYVDSLFIKVGQLLGSFHAGSMQLPGSFQGLSSDHGHFLQSVWPSMTACWTLHGCVGCRLGLGRTYRMTFMLRLLSLSLSLSPTHPPTHPPTLH